MKHGNKLGSGEKKAGCILEGMNRKMTSFDKLGVKDLKSNPNVGGGTRKSNGKHGSINSGRVDV
jgi:hypothetical protein